MTRAYQSYRPTGVPWLGQVPAHWRVDRLKWASEAPKNGIWGAEPDEVDDLICIRVADFDRTSLTILRAAEWTRRAIKQSERNGRLLEKGDLLLEKSGGGEKQLVGAVVEFDCEFPAVCSNFIARLEMREGMDSRFWTYFYAHLYAGRVNYPSIKQTTGIQNLDAEAYLNELVCFPPFEEQVAIGRYLDTELGKIDCLITNKRRLLTLLEEKRIAVITQAVTKGIASDCTLKDSETIWLGEIPSHWSIRKIKYVVDRVVDCLHTTPHYEGVLKYPAVRTADLGRGRLFLSRARLVSEDVYRERIGRLKPVAGDVLYSREGERFGFAALVPPNVDLCLGQRMMMFRASEEIVSEFLMWALNSEPIYQQVLLYSGGATSPHINIGDIINFFVPVPPAAEQTKIVGHIAEECGKLDSIAEKIEEAIAKLTEYRAALITNAVTGKIDVRETKQREVAA